MKTELETPKVPEGWNERKLEHHVAMSLPMTACRAGDALVYSLGNKKHRTVITKVAHHLYGEMYTRDIWVRDMTDEELEELGD